MNDAQREKNENRICEVIRQFGKPNPSFPNDIDLDYGTLQKQCNNIGGLASVLQQMKKKVKKKNSMNNNKKKNLENGGLWG